MYDIYIKEAYYIQIKTFFNFFDFHLFIYNNKYNYKVCIYIIYNLIYKEIKSLIKKYLLRFFINLNIFFKNLNTFQIKD